jgi:kanamycin kinase
MRDGGTPASPSAVTVPTGPVPIPDAVTRIAGGRPVRAVWVNELGGVTFRIGTEFVKTSRRDLTGEAERLRWAAGYLAVPRVLGVGATADGCWLHTAGLPGKSAVDPRWLVRPRQAARAIGVGLRALHDRLPVSDCPFDWSVRARLARLAPERRSGLSNSPPIEKLVVCHGDACAPNTLIADDGRCCGHVDFDQLGVADRWADLAVATLSLSWNYPGGSWDAELFAGYGVTPDPVRIDYYRRLWNAE